jgi:glycine betaine/choline ABC-type transport system substrate-binding protein
MSKIGSDTTWANSRARRAPGAILNSGTLRMGGVRSQSRRTCFESLRCPDGYAGLVATYGLRFAEQPRIMDLGLLARALKDHQIDFAGGNTTDGLIPALDLIALEDDRHFFPPYEAVPVMRQQTIQEHPDVLGFLQNLTVRSQTHKCSE